MSDTETFTPVFSSKTSTTQMQISPTLSMRTTTILYSTDKDETDGRTVTEVLSERYEQGIRREDGRQGQ